MVYMGGVWEEGGGRRREEYGRRIGEKYSMNGWKLSRLLWIVCVWCTFDVPRVSDVSDVSDSTGVSDVSLILAGGLFRMRFWCQNVTGEELWEFGIFSM